MAGALGQAFVTDYAFYGGESTHSVSVIAARGDVIGVAPAGYYPTGVAVSPDDRRIYVANNEGTYTNAHPGTTTVINATTGAVMDTLPIGGCAVAVSDLGNGLFQYTPSEQAVGGFNDRFAITVDDGHGGVVTKTVALGV